MRSILALGSLGEAARDRLDEVLAATEVPDPQVVEWAMWALGEIGGDELRVSAALRNGVRTGTSRVRETAIHAIGRLGARGSDRVALQRAAHDQTDRVRVAALEVLAQLDDHETLVDALADEAEVVREAARRELQSAGGRAIPALLAGFEHASARGRIAIAGLLAIDAGAVRSTLLAALDDPEPVVRSRALRALSCQSTLDPADGERVTKALGDDDARVRSAAAYAVGELRIASASTIQALASGFTEATREARRAFALAACKLATAYGSDSEVATLLPALIEALRDADAEVRCFAAWTLERLGPSAKPAASALQSALESDDLLLRRSAAWALDRIEAQGA